MKSGLLFHLNSPIIPTRQSPRISTTRTTDGSKSSGKTAIAAVLVEIAVSA